MPKTAPDAFIKWLNDNMEQREWSVRETARKAGISHTPISYVLSGDQPSFETCVALAKAFNQPVLSVLGLANLLELPDNYSPTQAEWEHLFQRLDPEDQQEMLAIARLKLQKKRKADTKPLPRLRQHGAEA